MAGGGELEVVTVAAFFGGFGGFEVQEDGAGVNAVLFGIARTAGLAFGRSGAGRWGGGERRLVIHALRVAEAPNSATD